LFGALAGLERFAALGATQITRSAFRLVSALGLVALGLGSTGALASLFVSSLSAVFLGTWLLRDLLRQQVRGAPPAVSGLLGDSLYTLLAMVGFAVLLYSDVVIVKNRFSPSDAGLYGAVATLGKVVLWLPAAVTVLLLPKVADKHTRRQPTAPLVRKGLLVTGLLCSVLAGACFLFPEVTMRAFFGGPYLAHSWLLGPYGLAMTVYSVVDVWLFYHIAVQDSWYAWALVAGAMGQVALLLMLPATLAAVIGVLIGTGCCLFVAGAWRLWRQEIRWD
jgi:O-antigen/teichoic acid export membrane protein